MPSKLSLSEREALLAPLLTTFHWTQLQDRDAIKKSFVFADFVQAFGFITQIALKAEGWAHHPEWFNVYNRVEITWSTHDCNGLSPLDIEAARFCDQLYEVTKAASKSLV